MILFGTNSAMSRCASSVLPPMWGVKITLGNPCNGVSKAPLLLGSDGYTSMAAPPSLPLFRALVKASISTTKPLERLMSLAPSFIWLISRSPMKFLLALLSSTCKVTTSETFNKSSKVSHFTAFPKANWSFTS